MNDKTYDVVAFGAHPDDLEHGMGGTLIKMCRDGMKLLLVHATHGEGGTHGDAALREREAACAADMLGADLHYLDFEDMNVRDTTEARKTVAAVIRQARPQIVFAPYYNYPHMHPDHEELGRIVRSVARLVRIKNYLPGIEPHYVKHFFYYILPHEIRPTFIIDVTDDMEAWRTLANCYSSQINGLTGYFDLLHTVRQSYGMLIGRPYAEAFYSDRPVDLTNVNLSDLSRDIQRMHH